MPAYEVKEVFEYGINGNQIVIHILGDFWVDDRWDEIEKMANDPRVTPGMVITCLGASENLVSIPDAKRFVSMIASMKPRTMCAVVYGEIAKENMKVYQPLLRLHGIDFWYYDCLDDMFNFVREKELG